jgi:hypothetical protein
MARFIQDRNLAERMGACSLEKMAPFTPACAAEKLADLALQTTQRHRFSSRAVVSLKAQ